MNERIKELALQAGYEKDMFGIGHWDMPECKKFAELLIRECAKVADTVEAWDIAPSGVIEKHFGVEE